jgi:tetratricopeptide (TPR) repeat protein
LGGLLGALGRIPEQGLVLQEAMAIDPLNELLAVNYAGNLYVRGDFDGARELLVNLVQLRPDSTTLLRTLAGYTLAHGDLVESWEYASRSYRLAPDSPVVVTAMAKTWLGLGDPDRAAETLQAGMAKSEDNADLKGQYFYTLLVAGRLEEAEQVIKELFSPDIESQPEQFQRYFYQQMGMLYTMRGQYAAARDSMEQAINLYQGSAMDGNRVFVLSMAAALNQKLGDQERADAHLIAAERAVDRARINGVDDAGIYYELTVLHALKGNLQQALAFFEEAYNRGWRDSLRLKMDGRLDALRDQPQFVELAERISDEVRRARSEVESMKVAQL